MDPEGYDDWQDNKAGFLWQQQLQEAKDKEEHRRHVWLAKKRNEEVVAEETQAPSTAEAKPVQKKEGGH